MKQDDLRKTIIFQHIPKTAGSTLHAIFNKRYPARETLNIFAGNYTDDEVIALRQLPREEAYRILLLKGHMPFGLHQYLPRPATYFTMLRDPVRRVVSQYFYIKNNPKNPLYDLIIKNKWSVGEFVSSGISVGMNNGQIRWILGEINTYPFNNIDQTHLERAKKNLENYYFLTGINERFDETALLLSQILGWNQLPYYHRQNSNRKKSSLSDEDVQIIEHYNRYDIELYKYASTHLDELISSLPGFERRFMLFQQRNKMFQWIYKPITLVSRN